MGTNQNNNRVDFMDECKEKLKTLYEIRKIELDVYWKKVSFYWTIIVAIYASYAYSMKFVKENDGFFILPFCICIISTVVNVSMQVILEESDFNHTNLLNRINTLESITHSDSYKQLISNNQNKYPLSDRIINKRLCNASRIVTFVMTVRELINHMYILCQKVMPTSINYILALGVFISAFIYAVNLDKQTRKWKNKSILDYYKYLFVLLGIIAIAISLFAYLYLHN